jgi:hypothetical protein
MDYRGKGEMYEREWRYNGLELTVPRGFVLSGGVFFVGITLAELSFFRAFPIRPVLRQVLPSHPGTGAVSADQHVAGGRGADREEGSDLPPLSPLVPLELLAEVDNII